MNVLWATVASALALATASEALGQEESDTQAPSEPSHESPEDEEARLRFQSGRAAFEAGRFEEALRDFERAHELSGRPELLFNIATAADRLSFQERALEAYRAFVDQVPESERRPQIEARVAVLVAEVEAEAEQQRQLEASQSAAHPAAGGGPRDETPEVYAQWWFWTIIAVVVLGGIGAGVGIALASQPTQAPLAGTNGVVIQTLLESRF